MKSYRFGQFLFCRRNVVNSVLPGPKTRKPPGFRQKKPPLAGVFLGQIFLGQIFRPTNKCPFLILFVPDLCYSMTSNV